MHVTVRVQSLIGSIGSECNVKGGFFFLTDSILYIVQYTLATPGSLFLGSISNWLLKKTRATANILLMLKKTAQR